MPCHEWQSLLLQQITQPQISADSPFPVAGLAVYRHHYRSNLLHTLQLIYPVCLQLVGEDFFNGMAREYTRNQPSLSGNLHQYGESFGDFIAQFPPANSLPYLADCARLEWAIHRSYYAADAEVIGAKALQHLTEAQWEQLTFCPQPSAALFSSAWPVRSIWQAHQQQPLQFDFALHQHPQASLIYRQAGNVALLALDPAQYTLLAALFAGAHLQQALAQTLPQHPDLDLSASLRCLFDYPVLAQISP